MHNHPHCRKVCNLLLKESFSLHTDLQATNGDSFLSFPPDESFVERKLRRVRNDFVYKASHQRLTFSLMCPDHLEMNLDAMENTLLLFIDLYTCTKVVS